MKTILFPFHDEEAGRTALSTAIEVAKRFESYLEGLLVRGYPHIDFPQGLPVPAEYLSQAAEQWRRFADAARNHFGTIAVQSGLEFGELEGARDGPAVAWREMEGREAQVVGEYGRLFDLIVLGRTTAQTSWQELSEAALFDTGRPVLLAPTNAPQKLGEVVVVAWNASTETARAVALGMPFLVDAAQVIVLSVEEGMLPGPSGNELSRHLLRHGVRASDVTVRASGRNIGEAFLEEAGKLGADLLVKGVFTRSRLRRLIFGDTTQHVLERARIPVLLAH